jgi:hypothetical protein
MPDASAVEVALAVGAVVLAGLAVQSPVFGVRNICILAVTGSTFAGWLLLPTATSIAGWEPPDSALRDRVEAMVIVGSLGGLLLFGGTFVVLDRVKPSQSVVPRRAAVCLWSDALRSAFLVVIMALLFFCSAVVLGVYVATEYVPWCRPQHSAAKYFEGVTDRYVALRPFYIAATNILPVVNAAALFGAWEAGRSRRRGFAVSFGGVTAIGLAVMASTLKRGELLFPLFLLLVAFLTSGRLRLRGFFLGLLVLLVTSVALDPRSSLRILGADLCGIARPADVPTPLRAWQVVANNFSVELRETTRLLYEFHERGQPWLWGRTYLAVPLVLVPSALSTLKREFELGRLTLRWWGNDPDRTSGPRVLGLSEAYINFGWAGAVFFPILVATIVWATDRLQRRWLRTRDDREAVAMAALLFLVAAYAGFGFYLNGSPALQTLVMRLVGIALIAAPLVAWARWGVRKVRASATKTMGGYASSP